MTQENISDTLEIQRLVGKFSNLESNAAEQKKFSYRQSGVKDPCFSYGD